MNEIKIGDHVKILRGAERFWVRLTGVKGPILTGWVDNDLVNSEVHGIFYEDVISFNSEEILDHRIPTSSEFSKFIRTATGEEKRDVFMKVIDDANKEQGKL
jgi:hypothetical protein